MANTNLTGLYVVASLAMTCMAAIAFAQAGSLDNAFGTGGKLIASLGNFGDEANAVAIQSDGKIVLGGNTRNSFTSSDFALVRCNQDGTLDPAFGTGGKVILSIDSRSSGASLAIQSNGKIVQGGYSNWFINLLRYNSDGTPDTTFGAGGSVITDIEGYYSEQCHSVVIQDNGKILVGGHGKHNSNDNPYFMLVRYNEDGTLDHTFGTDGIVIGGIGTGNSLAIQDDGKILLGGASAYQFALSRYHPDGTPDTAFGTGGAVITPVGISGEAHSIGIQSDGKIVLAGYGYNNGSDAGFALVRYHEDGTLDAAFGAGGKVITNIGNGRAVGNSVGFQSDGKILLGGNAVFDSNFSDFALVRYDSAGGLDNSFGLGGIVITPVGASYSNGNALGIQQDGKIVLGGYAYNGTKTDMVVVRYDGDGVSGTEEPVTNRQNCSIYPNPFATAATLRFNTPVRKAQVSICNAFGQEVNRIENVSGREIQIFRNNLPAGIYFLQLREENKIISVEKLIISEK